MSFFNWFSGRSRSATSAAKSDATRTHSSRDKSGVASLQRLAPEPGSLGDDRIKRHARREQLYVAIREAMTRSGVLSASYKFKVLSLDQQGDQFLVMMDLARVAGDPESQLGEIEALIVRNAKSRFSVTVSAVYWRLNDGAAVRAPGLHSPAMLRAATPLKPATPRHEPIQKDEVVAFQQALQAASALGRSPGAQKGVKTRGGLRSSGQRNDFADTEMFESASAPVLSNTQYGDLN
ncbi:MAG: hypothetical protein WB542_12100 [Polaromonas sp.]